MEEHDLQQQFSDLKEKFNKTQRKAAGLKEKAKYLEMQYYDARDREKNTNDLVMELLERQRELNVMLNRANIMLNRTQEVMALTSMEFNEMAKALPEPKKEEWSDRISKVNDLFRKTGVQDAEVLGLESPTGHNADSLSADELKRESEEAFPRKASIWNRPEKTEPPRVEVEIVEEEPTDNSLNEDDLVFGPHRKSWWRRSA